MAALAKHPGYTQACYSSLRAAICYALEVARNPYVPGSHVGFARPANAEGARGGTPGGYPWFEPPFSSTFTLLEQHLAAVVPLGPLRRETCLPALSR